MGNFQKVDLPEYEGKTFEIKKFEIDKHTAVMSMIRDAARCCEVGSYTKLVFMDENYHRHTMMSDTTAECRDLYDIIFMANGHVLINGLGIGLVIVNIIDNVDKITVIDNNKELLDVVGKHYQKLYPGKIELVHSDAFEYQIPEGIRYNCVWHDIWPTISTDNIEDMKKLHRKYGRKTDWQGSWCRYECERMRRQEKRENFF